MINNGIKYEFCSVSSQFWKSESPNLRHQIRQYQFGLDDLGGHFQHRWFFWFCKYKRKYTILNSLLTAGFSSWFICPLLLSDCSFSHSVMVPAPILNNIYKLNQEHYHKGNCNFSNTKPEQKKNNWRSIPAICRWLNFEGEVSCNCTNHLFSWLEEL